MAALGHPFTSLAVRCSALRYSIDQVETLRQALLGPLYCVLPAPMGAIDGDMTVIRAIVIQHEMKLRSVHRYSSCRNIRCAGDGLSGQPAHSADLAEFAAELRPGRTAIGAAEYHALVRRRQDPSGVTRMLREAPDR